MLESAENICHRPDLWTFSPICSSARARAARRSRGPTAHGDWGVRFPGGAALAVHAIVEGEVAPVDDAARAVACGCCPATSCSCASPRPSTWLTPRAPMPSRGRADRSPGAGRVAAISRRRPEDGPRATFFCGAYRFEGDLCHGLLAALPDLLPMRPAAGQHAARDDGPARRARCCATSPASRRCSTACSTWRSYRSCASTSPRRDERCARLVPRLRRPADRRRAARPARRPGRAWTVAELADEAALSRSAFARRFTELAGPGAAGLPRPTGGWRWPASGCATPTPRLAAIARLAGLRLGVLVRRGVQAPPRRRPRTLARRRAAPSDRLDRFLIRSPARGFPS